MRNKFISAKGKTNNFILNDDNSDTENESKMIHDAKRSMTF